ncbi:MAG: COX15/CtaA family protein [Candidatus Poseidoniales archaeon]
MAPWYRSHLIPFGLALIAFLIITTGGWIRISEAGESCPDWPTCFGTWGFNVTPEEQGEWWEENPDEIDSRGAGHRYTTDQIFTEWAHRGLVGIIGVLVLYSHYTAWSLKEKIGDKTYKIHYAVSIFLILQAVLGYVTVDLDNAPWTVSIHLFMALMFTTSLLAVGLLWWEGEKELPDYLRVPDANKIKNILWYTSAILLFQLLIGAYLSTSHNRAACGLGFYEGWPLCDNSIIPNLSQLGIFIQFGHRILAVIVGGLLLYVEREARNEYGNSKTSITTMLKIAGIFYFINILLGGLYIITAVDGDFLEWLSLLHLLIGALTFLITSFAYLICIIPSEVK